MAAAHIASTPQPQYKTGVIAAGGTGPLIREVTSCLKRSYPVFLFDETGGTSDEVASIMRFMDITRAAEKKLAALNSMWEEKSAAGKNRWKSLLGGLIPKGVPSASLTPIEEFVVG